MISSALWGISIPFLGTVAGASSVFFMKETISSQTTSRLNCFAAGVMLAASIWSLLIPALERTAEIGYYATATVVAGFFSGLLLISVLNYFFSSFERKNRSMLALSVNIHNLPEGMAIGAIYALLISSPNSIGVTAAYAVSLGIAIQNIPEGAIVSMPGHSSGRSKVRAFFDGVLSGAIEPLGAVLALLFYSLTNKALPFLLSFAAGAMIYVIVMELIPEIHNDKKPHVGLMMFSIGFCFMMLLDVILG